MSDSTNETQETQKPISAIAEKTTVKPKPEAQQIKLECGHLSPPAYQKAVGSAKWMCSECYNANEFDAMPSANDGTPANLTAETADPTANREQHVADVARELTLLIGSDHKTSVAARKLLTDYNNPDGLIHAIQTMRADKTQLAFAEKAGAMAVRDSVLTIAKRNGNGNGHRLDPHPAPPDGEGYGYNRRLA